MIVVSKFGGSSVSNPEQFRKVKRIIESQEARKVVVVSALGRDEMNSSKITDLLFLLVSHIKYKVDYSSLLESIINRYEAINKTLNLGFNIRQIVNGFLSNDLDDADFCDYLVSRGEYLSALLMAKYLGYTFVDSKDVIKFHYDGTIDTLETNRLLKEAEEKYCLMVIPGYYGSYANGIIKTFSRGGSDITGSLVAKAISADKYENFTDVSGILMADPKIVKNPKKIKEITYEELRELSYLGAEVLHEETLFPIEQLNIPIHILNTNHPEEEGTIIRNEASDKTEVITGVTGKKGFMSFTVVVKRGYQKLNVIRSVLDVFAFFQIPIEHIPTSVDSFSVVVEESLVSKVKYDLSVKIEAIEGVMDFSVDSDIALVAVVGRNMVTKTGISAQIFSVLGNQKINIKLIAQATRELNIIIGISNEDYAKAIQFLYSNLVND